MKRIRGRLFSAEFKREAVKLVTKQHLNVVAAGRGNHASIQHGNTKELVKEKDLACAPIAH